MSVHPQVERQLVAAGVRTMSNVEVGSTGPDGAIVIGAMVSGRVMVAIVVGDQWMGIEVNVDSADFLVKAIQDQSVLATLNTLS